MGMKSIWDGIDLPPVGCEVLAQLGSLADKHNKGGWVRHVVDGYRIKQVPEEPTRSVVFVKLMASNDKRSSKNERILCDVHPLDWVEA